MVVFRYLLWDLHRIDLPVNSPPLTFGRVEVGRNDKSKFVGLILNLVIHVAVAVTMGTSLKQRGDVDTSR